MKRRIIQTTAFEEEIFSLISKRKLKESDFEDFKKSLVENPKQGRVVVFGFVI